MRRLSVAVHNTIPKKLRERIDVPSILVIADSASSVSEEGDSGGEVSPKRVSSNGKKKRKVRRASESDAGSSFRPLFTGEWSSMSLFFLFRTVKSKQNISTFYRH